MLDDADAVGLSADDYKVEVPDDGFDVTQGTERQKQLMAFEMKLSVAVAKLHFSGTRTRGRVDTNHGIFRIIHEFSKRNEP